MASTIIIFSTIFIMVYEFTLNSLKAAVIRNQKREENRVGIWLSLVVINQGNF